MESNIDMKNVVVTGASGFIGKYLCRELLEKGYYVYGISRKKIEDINDIYFTNVLMDLNNIEDVKKKFKDINIKYFFHLAHHGVNGIVKSNYDIQLQNLLMTCKLANMMKDLSCERFIYAGSVDEFQAFNKPDAPYLPPNNARIYAISKYAAEQISKDICYDLGVEFVSALNPMVFGRGNQTNILPNVIMKNALNNIPVNLIEGNNKFDMIHIDDCVKAFVAVAEKGINMESYYVGHQMVDTFKNVVMEMCKVLELNIELKFGTYPDNAPVFDYNTIDLEKLYRDTGFKCGKDNIYAYIDTYKWLECENNGN